MSDLPPINLGDDLDREPPVRHLRLIKGQKAHAYGQDREDMVDARPCEHAGKIIIDEEWKTITCKECLKPIDFWAILHHYWRWQEELVRWEQERKRYELDSARDALQGLKGRAGITAEEKQAIDRTRHAPVGHQNQAQLTREARQMYSDIDSALRGRKYERRNSLRVRK